MTIYSRGEVPAYLMTKTQLGELEFPRVAQDQAQAWMECTDWRGRPDTVALYDVRQAPPSRASAAQLEAAQRSSVRVCGDCGARPDGALWTLEEGVRVCRSCLVVARLRREQQKMASLGRFYARQVADLLAADPGPAVVYVRRIRPPRAEGATRTPPVCALDLDLFADGRRTRMVLRLGGARNPHVPETAVPVAQAAPRVAALVEGRRLVAWDDQAVDNVQFLGERLRKAGVDVPGWHEVWQARLPARVWRGEVDVMSRGLRGAVDPGTSDRLALLLRRMADSAGTHDGGRGTSLRSTAASG